MKLDNIVNISKDNIIFMRDASIAYAGCMVRQSANMMIKNKGKEFFLNECKIIFKFYIEDAINEKETS